MLPNVVVLGAPKCGTTSLYRYFDSHPGIFVSKKKELHFFSTNQIKSEMKGPGDSHSLDGCPQSFEAYTSLFSEAVKFKVRADISPSYFVFPECFKSIKSNLPNPKVVLILRNPIDKCFSQYMHLVREARELESFETALSLEYVRTSEGYSDFWRYVNSSYYANRVRQMLDCFGETNCLVIFQEELKLDPESVMNEIFEFIEVEKYLLDYTKEHNKSGVPKNRVISRLISPGPMLKLAKKIIPVRLGSKIKSQIQDWNTGEKLTLSPQVRCRLKNEFSLDVVELQKILNRKLPWDDFYD